MEWILIVSLRAEMEAIALSKKTETPPEAFLSVIGINGYSLFS